MVECFNRTLLQMFRTYLQDRADWKALLPLLLFVYRTAVHSTTGVSPFEMMFGRSLHIADFPSVTAFDAGSYHHKLQDQLAELRHFVEAKQTLSAHRQKMSFDRHTRSHRFQPGDTVWLSNSTGGKLSPRWEGGGELSK